MTKTIPFILGFALASALWFHVSIVGQANVSKDFFARIDRLPTWVLPKIEIAEAAEPVKVTPEWVTNSQKLIETWSEFKLSENEPEYVTKKRVVDALRVAYGESGLNDSAKFVNSDGPKSIDRGFWQINNHWHPDISDECAYYFECANYEAMKIYKSRSNWTAWYAAEAVGVK